MASYCSLAVYHDHLQVLEGMFPLVNSSFAQAHFRQPWAAPPDAPLVAGSLHADRILVEQSHLRKLLKRFRGLAHDASAGISQDEHKQLLSELYTHPLKPYLVCQWQLLDPVMLSTVKLICLPK